MTTRSWTVEEIRALGVRTDLETAASIWGIGRTKAFELARLGEFPSPVVRVGAKYVVPIAPLMRALGLLDEEAAADSSTESTASVHALAKSSGGHQHAPHDPAA